jgi:hypothetical protein
VKEAQGINGQTRVLFIFTSRDSQIAREWGSKQREASLPNSYQFFGMGIEMRGIVSYKPVATF